MVIKAAALIVAKDEDRILPGITVHEGRNDGLHKGGALLHVGVRMLVKSAAAGRTINEDNLRQSFVGIAWIAAAHPIQAVEQVSDLDGFWLDSRIEEILELRQENSILVVISPAHVGIVHGAENGLSRVLGMICIAVWILVPERRACHQVKTVRIRVCQEGRMPRIAGGKKCG